MCLICSQWELGKLTTKEARNNLKELIIYSPDDPLMEHYTNLEQYFWEKEREEQGEQ